MSDELWFRFEGRRLTARPGQSLGGALLAAGVRTLSRSAKYRRPRGLRCCRGACPCCQVRVDGLPGIAACTTPVRGGERVERERPAAAALPLGAAARLTRAGFYRAPWLGRPGIWSRAEPILATLAGVSQPPAANAGRIGTFAERVVDVLVVGAGERGLTEAAEAARSGASVLVVDRDWLPGGRMLDEPGGAQQAAGLAAEGQQSGAELLLEATALGGDPDGVWGVVHAEGLLAVRPGRVELATGRWDRELSLPDGDRPGVLTGGAVRRLLVREGVRPGRTAVVVSTEDGDSSLPTLLADRGIRVAASCAPGEVTAVTGREAVRGARIGRRHIACDVLVIDAGSRPADELARQQELGAP